MLNQRGMFRSPICMTLHAATPRAAVPFFWEAAQRIFSSRFAFLFWEERSVMIFNQNPVRRLNFPYL